MVFLGLRGFFPYHLSVTNVNPENCITFIKAQLLRFYLQIHKGTDSVDIFESQVNIFSHFLSNLPLLLSCSCTSFNSLFSNRCFLSAAMVLMVHKLEENIPSTKKCTLEFANHINKESHLLQFPRNFWPLISQESIKELLAINFQRNQLKKWIYFILTKGLTIKCLGKLCF